MMAWTKNILSIHLSSLLLVSKYWNLLIEECVPSLSSICNDELCRGIEFVIMYTKMETSEMPFLHVEGKISTMCSLKMHKLSYSGIVDLIEQFQIKFLD